jgi:hypothetical protein
VAPGPGEIGRSCVFWYSPKPTKRMRSTPRRAGGCSHAGAARRYTRPPKVRRCSPGSGARSANAPGTLSRGRGPVPAGAGDARAAAWSIPTDCNTIGRTPRPHPSAELEYRPQGERAWISASGPTGASDGGHDGLKALPTLPVNPYNPEKARAARTCNAVPARTSVTRFESTSSAIGLLNLPCS